MKKIQSLQDYKLAKSVALDFPIIIKSLDEAISTLEKYKHYTYPQRLLFEIRRAKLALNTQLNVSHNVLHSDTKGPKK